MSFDFFDWRDAVFSATISPPARSTAFALTKWADSATGVFWPHQNTMVEYMGTPVSTLRRHLRELEEAGLLVTTTTQMGGARIWSKNEYRLVIPIDLRPSAGAGTSETTTDLRPPVSAGDAFDARPPLIHGATSAHFGDDLRPPVVRPPLTHGRQEQPSELPRELPREQTASFVAKTDATPARAKQYRDRPLMNSVPDRSDALQHIEIGVPDLTAEERAHAEYWLSLGDSEVTVMKQLRDDRRVLRASRSELLLTEEVS